MRTPGRAWRRAIATPEISPPPPIGTTTVPTDLYYPVVDEGAFSTGVFLAASTDPDIKAHLDMAEKLDMSVKSASN